MNYQTLVFGDKQFKLVRTLEETSKFTKGVADLKLLWNCDTVLKKNGMLYFCRAIEDIEYETIP